MPSWDSLRISEGVRRECDNSVRMAAVCDIYTERADGVVRGGRRLFSHREPPHTRAPILCSNNFQEMGKRQGRSQDINSLIYYKSCLHILFLDVGKGWYTVHHAASHHSVHKHFYHAVAAF